MGKPLRMHGLFAQRTGYLHASKLTGEPHLKSILLVDYSGFMRMANEKALARAGYRVFIAGDGEEALLIARQGSDPDSIRHAADQPNGRRQLTAKSLCRISAVWSLMDYRSLRLGLPLAAISSEKVERDIRNGV
jgi:hypothetical protein